ncbi:unnamed protein product [Schistosoma turkestanicum]|nr:unnamed protein product [Schistosoma turkestanicum]
MMYTWLCATLAAGSVKHLTELILTNQLSNGLALIRPPGHHAMHSEACGYCIFNNIAVTVASFLQPQKSKMTKSIQSRSQCIWLQRILIIDWDVHHGQGTQYAFYDDNRVLYISIHRYEKAKFWPNLREANYDFIGEHLGKGYNVNIPLEETDLTDSDYLAIFYRLIMPIATEFNPQLILVSCGFDAAIGCPEGKMWLTPMIFGHFVHKLKSLAGGKVVVVLEGGYFVDSLAEGIVHVLKALLGDPLSPVRLIQPICSSVKNTIESCISVLHPYWKSLLASSQPVELPNLDHLPTITWPLVKVVAWPETNPQLPRVLTNQIQHLLINHLPAPLSITTNESLFRSMTLMLLPTTTQLSVLRHLQSKRGRKQKNVSLESLMTAFKDQFHIHLYKQDNLPSGDYLYSKTTTNSQFIQSSSISRYTTNKINSNINDADKINKSSMMRTNCDCLNVTFNSTKHQINKNIDNSMKFEQEIVPNFHTALSHAISLILMGQFQQLYFINDSFNLVELLKVITNIPLEYLVNYRERIFRPRGFQMNSNSPTATTMMEVMRTTSSFLNNSVNQYNKLVDKFAHVYSSYSNQSNLSSSKSSSTSLLIGNRSEISTKQTITKSDGGNMSCRVMVLDLSGTSNVDCEKLKQFECLVKETSQEMKCE